MSIKQPVRLLFVIGNTDIGGAQRNVHALLSYFARDSDILLAYGDEGPFVDQVRRLGIPTRAIVGLGRRGGMVSSLSALWKLCRLAKNFRAQIMHAHNSKAGLIARLAGFLIGIPTVYTAHGWGFKPGVPLRRRYAVWLFEAICVAFSSRIIAVSDYDYQLGLRCLFRVKEKLRLIPNGLADQELIACTPLNPPTVIMVARFREPKRQDLLLQAAASLSIRVEVWFVGDGPQRKTIEAMLCNYPKTGGAGFRFFGEQEDVVSLLRKASIFVLLSDYEGLPISVLEAMRASLPVVGSRVGGIPELVQHGVTGFLVNNHVDAIREALNVLLTNHSLREAMGRAARQRFVSHYQEGQMLRKTRAVYAEALSE